MTPASAITLMIFGVFAVYVRPALFTSRSALVGVDYLQLHLHRIRYAREALATSLFGLPGWFTRETLGAPFFANIQSFPWIPTRLILLALDPFAAYAPAVALSAVLAALFTYLFARAAKLSPTAAAIAGWTFACSGFFASRVMAGQLALLEAFPALPCLLWLAHRACERDRDDPSYGSRWLALGLTAAAFALAGHPQLPAYAIVAAFAYVVARDRSRALKAASVLAAGCGLTLFAWWPMLRYAARSSRLLGAGRPANDIVLPWWRLGALVFPWKDGWTAPVLREPAVAFSNSNPSYFWDTVSYTGILPLVATVFLAVLLARKRPLDRTLRFVLAAGAVALALAIPPLATAVSALPVVVLRSPARLLYIVEFALALGLGAALDHARSRLGLPLIALLIGAHVVDLARHDMAFVRLMPLPLSQQPTLEPFLPSLQPGERVAIDHTVTAEFNRTVDDAGFYDSLMPGPTYRALMALEGYKETPSTENFDAGALSGAVLEQLGVRLVLTTSDRNDMPLVRSLGAFNIFAAKNPVPRATFVPDALVRHVTEAELLDGFRTRGLDLRRELLLDADGPVPAATDRSGFASVQETLPTYLRSSSDEAKVSVQAPAAGFVRLTESWDPGWRARLDGNPAEVVRADGFLMAVHLPAGSHEITFRYETPGKWLGLAGSAASLVLLLALARGGRASSGGEHELQPAEPHRAAPK
jgi:hypothetical protein